MLSRSMARAAVSTSGSAAPLSRRIALLKPAAATDERINQALALLDSIVWACRGTTRSTWTVAPPEAADVVVVHQNDGDERIPLWRSQGKPVIEISTASPSDAAPPGVLVYPFRTAQVLALLNTLDEHLKSGELPAQEPSVQTQAPKLTDPWGFIDALRTLRSVQNSEAWLVGREARMQVLWLRGDGATYAADTGAVEALRNGSLNPNKLTLQKGAEPSGALPQRSGIELSWFAGYHASGQLAPALNAATRYRIGSWPNFGLIRPLPSQLRVAAVLASMAGNLREISARAKVSAEDATRTLNALHACDALVAAQSGEAPAAVRQPMVPEPRGGLAKFLSNLRKHLRIGASLS